MKLSYTLVFLILIIPVGLFSQSVEELELQKSELKAAQAKIQAEVDEYQGQINDINEQIKLLSGWQKGLFGNIGLGFGATNKWASSANPNSSNSNLGIGVTTFANKITEKDFWRNKAIINLNWQSLDTNTDDNENDGFLDDRTTDLLNLSSLYGRRLNDNIALSGLAELNSSVFNFLNPGTFDLGVGATWTPENDLVVVIHPLNYHAAFSGIEGVSSEASLGSKIRADYSRKFSNGLGWSTTFSTFIPYVSKDPTLFEYTWLNSLSYSVWKGIGVGVSFGVRNAEFESSKLQSFYTVGISYGF